MSAPTRPHTGSQEAANGAPKPTAQPKRVAPEQLTGAQSVIRSLEELDVDVIFGIPGGAVLPVYDPLFDSKKLRHVLVRHEQGAGHAASGYAHATGRVGVCMATSGHGATNLVTPLADAQMDSIPVVAITGQVGRGLIGTDAFQEADISGITMPITKHNFLVRSGDDIPRVLAEAFHIASSGRPGAVLVDIPKDVLQAQCTFSWPPKMDLPGYKPNTKPHSRQIREAAKLIGAASKPVLYVGGGVIRGEATEQLRDLAELTGIPVVTTLMARGAFPDSHPQNLGMPGMHGTVAAVAALQRSDLLIALGTRFDDRVTGQLDSFAPEAKVIHADIDPAEIGKNRHADVPIVGDVKAVITELIAMLRHYEIPGKLDMVDWWRYLQEVQSTYPLSYGPQSDGSLSPEYVIATLGSIAGPDAVYVAGVGQHQMWAAQRYRSASPRGFITSGGLGSMGFALPAAVGVQLSKPDATVLCVSGDGGFQMNIQELATVRRLNLPIKMVIVDNKYLGMVRQWQQLFYQRNYAETDLSDNPDFVEIAKAYRINAVRVQEDVMREYPVTQDTADALERFLRSPEPELLVFDCAPEANVYPMVPAGAALSEMLFEEE